MGRKRRYRHRIVIPHDIGKRYKPPTKKERITLFLIGFTITIGVLFNVFVRDTSIKDTDLINVGITLAESPIYSTYKSGSIILRTREHSKTFKIEYIVLDALDVSAFKSEIKKEDKLVVQMLKSDLTMINYESLNENNNVIYNLIKNGKSYVDMNYANQMREKDRQYSLPFIFIGLLLIGYAFVKGKPLISWYSIPIMLFIIILIVQMLFKYF